MDVAKITSFGGMVPITDDTVLSEHLASLSQNTWLYAGVLDGLPQPTFIRDCAVGTAKIYRIPISFPDAQHIEYSDWLEFPHQDTDIIRSPIADDTYDRYYWASPIDVPRYNTKARIQNSDSAWKLGVPAPSSAPNIDIVGGTGPSVTRAYVYTWVTEYGEEGPPSAPMLSTGNQDGTWELTFAAALASDLGTDRLLAKTRIYRTVTSATGVAAYYFVAEIDIAVLTHNDALADSVVSANDTIESVDWTEPPFDLKGWANLPNGMIAGFRGNEIWFCEPYRPHAWPVSYVQTVEYPIVGLGVTGQTLVVCTEGYPVLLFGVNPISMTPSRITNYEPCTSRGSILSSPEGVYYSSPNGLVLVANGRARVITSMIFSKDVWQQLAYTPTLRAGRLGTAIYMFGISRPGVFEPTAWDQSWVTLLDYTGSYTGVMVDPENTKIGVTVLKNDVSCVNIMNDPWSGELLIIRDNRLYWVDITNRSPTKEIYIWRSKLFQLNHIKNLAGCKIYFTVPEGSPTLNPIPNTDLSQTLAEDQWGLVRVYYGINRNHVFTREIRSSGELIRLPSGFKSEFWQIEVEARVKIKSIHFGSSVKALSKV